MKKYIVGIILIVIICLLFSIISFSATTPTLYIKDVTKYQNEDKVTIELYMENVNDKIVTFGLDVLYDSSKLEYASSKAGKDLNASFKLAENVKEESRVAIGAVSFDGFKENGLYYSITFKVKENSGDIPVKLKLREVSDNQGNDIKVNTIDGIIKISSEETVQKDEKITIENQKINEFEKTDVNELDTIENIINSDGSIEISDSDDLIYEIEKDNIVEVLDDGTMIPNQDGTTNIRVKLNDKSIGNVEVEVKDGKIFKVSGNDKDLNFVAEATTQEDLENTDENQTKNENYKNEPEQQSKEDISNFLKTNDKKNSKQFLSSSENETKNLNTNENVSNLKIVAIAIVIITILFIIFYTIKKKRGGKR